MKRIEALKKLAEKVENASDIWPSDFPKGFRHVPRAIHAFEGSLDAAKALHEAVLPGWVTWDASHTYFGYEVSLTNGPLDVRSCLKDNPARAWLLAIIKALISQEEINTCQD